MINLISGTYSYLIWFFAIIFLILSILAFIYLWAIDLRIGVVLGVISFIFWAIIFFEGWINYSLNNPLVLIIQLNVLIFFIFIIRLKSLNLDKNKNKNYNKIKKNGGRK